MSGINKLYTSVERTYFAFKGYDEVNHPSAPDKKVCYDDPAIMPHLADEDESQFIYDTIKDNFRVEEDASAYALLAYLDSKSNNVDAGYINVDYLLSYATKLDSDSEFAQKELHALDDYLEDASKMASKFSENGNDTGFYTKKAAQEMSDYIKF